jgi:transcriptional regulator with XRE-family HTH domain
MVDTFGSILTYLRKRAGLSQAQLAKYLNVTPATIGLYEQDRRKPSFEMQEKIADYFNVSLDVLHGGDSVKVPVSGGGDITLTQKELKLIMELRQDQPQTMERLIKYMELIKDLYK